MAPTNEVRKFFEVSVHQDDIKAFSTALHLLQKVGKEMTVEIEPTSFTLRALNDTKSTFAAVEFADNYFDSYQLATTLKSFSCKIAVKPVCVIFRSLKGMKLVRIRAGMVDSSEHELVFEIVLTNDIIRTYRFRYQDCEVMSAVFDEDSCSYARAKPKLFVQLLNHIYQSPEICIEAGASSFSVRSFHRNTDTSADGGAAGSTVRFMQTGLSLNLQEFDQYEYVSTGQSEELIFCVKEVNAFLGYAEVLDIPDFELFFSHSGRAIKFSARQDAYTASLILATIESAQHRMLASQQQQQQQHQQRQGRGQQSAMDTSVLEEEEEEEEEDSQPTETAEVRGGAGEEEDYSQPVTAFRRRALRGEGSSSAFLRYAGVGDDEGEDEDGSEGLVVSTVAQQFVRDARTVHAEANQRMDVETASARGPAQPARRKRFLDEASDDD